MYTVSHGGGCCGINHIQDFGREPNKGSVSVLKKILNDNINNSLDHSMLFEIALNEDQFPSWNDELVAIGFRPVSMFKNPNSGNECKVYHYTKEPLL
jgi:hypothetical protein